MDTSLHREHEAYRQRFRTLHAQIQALHAEWEARVQENDHARQADLINQEHALLTEVHTLIAAFQARVAERHQWEGRIVRAEEALSKDTG